MRKQWPESLVAAGPIDDLRRDPGSSCASFRLFRSTEAGKRRLEKLNLAKNKVAYARRLPLSDICAADLNAIHYRKMGFKCHYLLRSLASISIQLTKPHLSSITRSLPSRPRSPDTLPPDLFTILLVPHDRRKPNQRLGPHTPNILATRARPPSSPPFGSSTDPQSPTGVFGLAFE